MNMEQKVLCEGDWIRVHGKNTRETSKKQDEEAKRERKEK